MTQSFVNGVGLPGQAMVTNQPVWIAGRELLMTSHCERARQGQVFGLQTIFCFPWADGVIELGSTELIYKSADIMKKVRGSFNFSDQARDDLQLSHVVQGGVSGQVPSTATCETGSQNSIHERNSSHEVGGEVSGQPPSISDMARENMSSGGTHSYSRDHSAPSWNSINKRDSSQRMTHSDSVQQLVGGDQFGWNDFSEVSSKP